MFLELLRQKYSVEHFNEKLSFEDFAVRESRRACADMLAAHSAKFAANNIDIKDLTAEQERQLMLFFFGNDVEYVDFLQKHNISLHKA